MKVLIAKTTIKSYLKGHVYAERMAKVEEIGFQDHVGFYMNSETGEKFPTQRDNIIEIEIPDVVVETKHEEKVIKKIAKVWTEPIKKKVDTGQISLNF